MRYCLLTLSILLVSFSSFAIAPITGSPYMCVAVTRHLSDATPGGVWLCSNTSIATIVPTTGDVTGLLAGTATIIYSVGSSFVTMPITVSYSPSGYGVTGGGNYCAGGAGVHIGLTGSDTAVSYMLFSGPFGTVSVTGTGGAVDFGLITVAGTYTVVGTGTHTTCSTDMGGSAVVTVIPSVIPSANIAMTPDTPICDGTSVLFFSSPVNGGPAPHFAWTVNNLTVGGDADHYSFVPANGDVVKVTLASNATCPLPDTVSDSMVMTVYPQVAPSVTLLASPSDTVCSGFTLTHTAIGAYGGSAPFYMWIVNNNYVASGPAYSYVPGNGDSVTCVMMSNYFCRTADFASSPTAYIEVDMPVIPVATITASPGYVIKMGVTDTLRVTVASGAPSLTYQWYRNTMAIPGATDDTYISSDFDTVHYDSISCRVTSNGACVLTTLTWVIISVDYLGVSNYDAGSNLAIFPNPNNGTFTVKGSSAAWHDADVSLEVTDVLGQVVYRKSVVPRNGGINEQVALDKAIPNGMYLLHVKSGAGNSVVRVVVQ